eukprot:jgi/Botrbrau1/3351/Bobra.0048s0045.1
MDTLFAFLSNIRPGHAAVAFTVLAFIIYGLRPLGRWKLRHLPGPPQSWLVGNLLTIFAQGVHNAYHKWSKEYGKIFKVQFGPLSLVVVTDAEVGRSVNLRNLLRPELLGPGDLLKDDYADYIKANMLIAQDREYHRSLKNAWLPFFYSGSLDGYAAEMVACADVLVGRVAQAAAEKRTINIWRMMGDMTMDVVGTCAFGVSFRTQEWDKSGNKDAQDLIFAARDIFQLGNRASYWFYLTQLFPFSRPLVRVLATAFPDAGLRRVRDSRILLFDTAKKLLDKERQRLASEKALPKGAAAEAQDKENVRPPNAEVDAKSNFGMNLGVSASEGVLGHSEHSRGDEGVKEGGEGRLPAADGECPSTRTAAPSPTLRSSSRPSPSSWPGMKTTGSTLGFCVYNLARYPDKMAKLCKELDSIPKGHIPTADELAVTLPYLNAVFKETLRLYPVGVLTIRKLSEACNLLGYNLAKDTIVHVNWFSIHRDPEIWKDPEEFIPERWIDGEAEAKDRPQNAWFPFGDGNLVCVGMRFAQEEAKIALIRLFQKFTFKLAPGQIPLETAVPLTLGPKEGIFVIPEARHA